MNGPNIVNSSNVVNCPNVVNGPNDHTIVNLNSSNVAHDQML